MTPHYLLHVIHLRKPLLHIVSMNWSIILITVDDDLGHERDKAREARPDCGHDGPMHTNTKVHVYIYIYDDGSS